MTGFVDKPDNELIIKSLQKHKGNLTKVAQEFKRARNTVVAWIKSEPILKDTLHNSRFSFQELAVNKIYGIIENIPVKKPTKQQVMILKLYIENFYKEEFPENASETAIQDLIKAIQESNPGNE